LRQKGAAVVVNCAGSQHSAIEVIAIIESRAGRAIALQANMGKVDDIRRLFTEKVDQFDN
jgi:3-oxoacyl-[acyl-carrier protein] reductase